MSFGTNGHNSVNTVEIPEQSQNTNGTSKELRSGLKISGRGRQHQVPVPVEATVYWWRSDEGRGSYAPNQFGVMPATPVRFRCVGTLTPKYPHRYRVDLAQALDWLPYLAGNELKELGASLALIISNILGVDVAPISKDVIDLNTVALDA